MLPVSLTYADLIRLVKYCGHAVLLLTVGIVFLRRDELQINMMKVIWQSVSTALVAPPMLMYGLSKLKWKHPWLARLVGKRMVHGLWWGELKTEYRPSANMPALSPIPIAFVIKQSYFFLTIQSYTSSLPAHSTLETMIVEPRSETAQLQYVFEMRRLQDAEDKITTGYGDLRLTSDDKVLDGYYWTNSPTRGRVTLQLLTRDCGGIDSFSDAEIARVKFLRTLSSAPTGPLR